MTENVVSLADKRLEREPHWSGAVRCLGCAHEWVAVAPVGVVSGLACPACGLNKGVPKNLYGPGEGYAALGCNCGADSFFAYLGETSRKVYVRCVGCGSDLTEALFNP